MFAKGIDDLKAEMLSCRKELQVEILTCSKLINQVDSSTATKISAIEEENNILYRRINRTNLIIPLGLDDLIALY
ncbi:hypothetical protein CVS40_4832 [Lucilia cuprina]|nr:hypothetical protein CVS40_4832 [Lucilia cuprina]